jgi:hypothetical protein
MKQAIVLAAVLVVVAAGALLGLRLKTAADVNAAGSFEAKGDYHAALSRYANALDRAIPSLRVPDVNRSKVLSPASWKKEMEEYAAWLQGSSSGKIDLARRNAVLDAVKRTAARVNEDNFTGTVADTAITVEQFAALWNRAYFARGVTADSSHAPLAASCFGRGLSIVRISALTSFTYDISLVDTVANRRTVFTVYPEGAAFVLAAPGSHLLICRSSYQPEPGKIWRSAPTMIPLAVPAASSLVSFTIQTRVVRGEEARQP